MLVRPIEAFSSTATMPLRSTLGAPGALVSLRRCPSSSKGRCGPPQLRVVRIFLNRTNDHIMFITNDTLATLFSIILSRLLNKCFEKQTPRRKKRILTHAVSILRTLTVKSQVAEAVSIQTPAGIRTPYALVIC